MNHKRGVLIIALGHANYGRMAYNLAATIKFADPGISIALVYNKSTMDAITHNDDLNTIIDHFIGASPADYFTEGRRDYMKAKTLIYDYSPFEETIYLDADMAWIGNKKITALFDQYSNIDFTMQNSGFMELDAIKVNSKFSQWVNMPEVAQKYGPTGRYYLYHSELIFFRKNERMEGYFIRVKELYLNPGIEIRPFGHSFPDEPAFSLASIQMEVYPHQDNYYPSYWVYHIMGMRTSQAIYDKYYLLSMGANRLPEHILDMYNNICKLAFSRLNLGLPWKAKNKRTFLKERETI